MRRLLYLLSFAFSLPSVVFAAAFLILDDAIAAGSLPGFFGALLEVVVWLLPWGLLAILAGFVALLLGGLSSRFRWLASVCVAILAIGASMVVLVLAANSGNFSPDQLSFFVPAAFSASASIWLAIREWPRRNRASSGA